MSDLILMPEETIDLIGRYLESGEYRRPRYASTASCAALENGTKGSDRLCSVRPVWIEVVGAVAHAATIMRCRRRRQNRAALTPKPRRPQAARMPQAQNVR